MTILEMVKGMKRGHEIIDQDCNYRKGSVGDGPYTNFWLSRETTERWRWVGRKRPIHSGTAEEAAAALERHLKRR